MSDPTLPATDVYPVLRYADGRAAIDWLVRVFGAESRMEVPGHDGSIGHAELLFGRGMLMLAGSRHPDPANPWSTERGGVYVVVEDIGACYARAQAAGARIVRPLADTSYGAREFSARDLEGHLWSFGTYRP